MFKLNRKQKAITVTTLAVGAVAAVYIGRKYDGIIETAKEAGVNEWLREMHDNKLTVMVLTQELAEKMYATANEAVGTADMFPVYGS